MVMAGLDILPEDSAMSDIDFPNIILAIYLDNAKMLHIGEVELRFCPN